MEIIFIFTIVICGISLILSITGGIVLGRLSSKLLVIEKEIDKKSAEFDAIRKELTKLPKPPENDSKKIENYIPDAQEGIFNPTNELPPGLRPEDTIKIIRNVHGKFEEYNSFSIKENKEEKPPLQGSLASEDMASKENSEYLETNKQEAIREGTKVTSYKNQFFPPNTFTINLYSDLTKDADFHRMWRELSEILKNNVAPHIIINLGGIHFLYEKEMEYLEKINTIIKNSGGILSFVNCDRDLYELFYRHPQLITLVKKM